MEIKRILVCGATGYVGGRLVPRLLDMGYFVRCLVRSQRKLDGVRWRDHPQLEVIQGDLDDVAVTHRAVMDVDAAYYLVHAMISAGADYAERDRELAGNTASSQAILFVRFKGPLASESSTSADSASSVPT